MRKKGFKHSIETKKKISISNTGNKSSQWKGDNIKYQAIHNWLRKNFGKANKCENKECNHRSKIFEYVLIKGRLYERKRENFKMMCKSCHHKYDMTDDIKTKISKGNKGRIISEKHKKILSNRMKLYNPSFGGLSEEHKQKIKQSMLWKKMMLQTKPKVYKWFKNPTKLKNIKSVNLYKNDYENKYGC